VAGGRWHAPRRSHGQGNLVSEPAAEGVRGHVRIGHLVGCRGGEGACATEHMCGGRPQGGLAGYPPDSPRSGPLLPQQLLLLLVRFARAHGGGEGACATENMCGGRPQGG
jgi:hypothetical protein